MSELRVDILVLSLMLEEMVFYIQHGMGGGFAVYFFVIYVIYRF